MLFLVSTLLTVLTVAAYDLGRGMTYSPVMRRSTARMPEGATHERT
jgi:hypothetical protein